MAVGCVLTNVPLIEIDNSNRSERVDLAGRRRHRGGKDHRDNQPHHADGQVTGHEREEDVVGVVKILPH